MPIDWKNRSRNTRSPIRRWKGFWRSSMRNTKRRGRACRDGGRSVFSLSIGAPLSHAAILARELAIPAVVGSAMPQQG
ncbi:hypothetical protein JSQ80_10260 [Paenibacillus apiarius]|nr:hypothetical protein [Paenibacillus apiarius]